MAKFKVHWGDRFGAVCGAVGQSVGTVIAPHNLHQVTCKKCLRKLAEMARALSGFADMVDGLTKTRERAGGYSLKLRGTQK